MINLAQSTVLIHRYGNVGKTPEGLLKEKPTPAQFAAAKECCLRTVEEAFQQLSEYHKIGESDVH